MNYRHNLSNLLDNHICRIETAALMEGLQHIRGNAFDVWASRCRSRRLHKAIGQTLDDALVLALTVEYLQRARPDSERRHYPEDFVTQDCIGDMASVAEMKGMPSWARFSNLLKGKLVMPTEMRRLIFCESLPSLFAAFQNELPITILGNFHQMCLATPLTGERLQDERRAKGAYYTPPSLVDYMVARMLAAIHAEKVTTNGIRILDPSCGCGAFLIAVLQHLATQTNKMMPVCLCGSDVDARAVTLASLSLILAALCLTGYSRSDSTSAPIRNRRLVVQDFLASDTWRNEQFDLIIGGPPFIRVEQLHNIDPDRVREYRSRYVTAQSSQFDLYMPFIEKSINLLKPGGRLAFSVSNSFLRNKSGAKLRQFIGDNSSVEEIVEFEDGNIYPDASVQIAILLIRKAESRAHTRYAFVPKDGPVREHLKRMLQPAKAGG